MQSLVDSDLPDCDKKLKSVLDDLANDCNRYASLTRNAGSGPGSGKTKLDKERNKMCLREIVSGKQKGTFNLHRVCVK